VGGALAAFMLPATLWSASAASAASSSSAWGAAAVSVPPPKQAFCSADACTGQRPELTGCDKDGQTVRTGQVFGADGKAVGTIELRWSAQCRTNWARVTSAVGVQPLSVTVTRDDAKSTASNFRGTQTWSPMVWVGATGKAVATGWIGKASGAVADGVPQAGPRFD
jgi:hypothetical protein